MISYPAILDVPTQLLHHLAGLLAMHRQQIGTRPGRRALSCTDRLIARAVASPATTPRPQHSRTDRSGWWVSWPTMCSTGYFHNMPPDLRFE